MAGLADPGDLGIAHVGRTAETAPFSSQPRGVIGRGRIERTCPYIMHGS